MLRRLQNQIIAVLFFVIVLYSSHRLSVELTSLKHELAEDYGGLQAGFSAQFKRLLVVLTNHLAKSRQSIHLDSGKATPLYRLPLANLLTFKWLI